MAPSELPAGGWAVVAEHEGAASLVGSIIRLDAERTYTRSELADAAGVPLKELYLSDSLAMLADVGLLQRVEDADEETFTIEDGSPVYERAAEFDDAVTTRLDG